MNTDIRVDISLPRHWKYRKLKRSLGCSPMEYLIVFWTTIAEQKPNGELNGWSTEDIEDAAGWDGEPGAMCEAFTDAGFLDVTENGFYPHDWAVHQPWAIGAKERSEAARKAGKASAESRKKKVPSKPTDNERPVDEPFNGLPTDDQRNGNPRTPSPSPSPKEEGRASVIPYDDILAAFNLFCPSLPHTIAVNEKRRTAIKAVFEKYANHTGGPLRVLDQLFKKAECSPFLTGKERGYDGKFFKADFDWLLTDDKMVLTLEGKYDKAPEPPPRKKELAI